VFPTRIYKETWGVCETLAYLVVEWECTPINTGFAPTFTYVDQIGKSEIECQ